jgi:hypothetical protein
VTRDERRRPASGDHWRRDHAAEPGGPLVKKRLAAIAITSVGVLGAAAPAGAARAETSAEWTAGCTTVVATSTKDISNVVYRVDGVDTRIELAGGFHTILLPGAATDVWVKSGNNRSGDGPGYGEHHARPATCDGGGPPPPL